MNILFGLSILMNIFLCIANMWLCFELRIAESQLKDANKTIRMIEDIMKEGETNEKSTN